MYLIIFFLFEEIFVDFNIFLKLYLNFCYIDFLILAHTQNTY